MPELTKQQQSAVEDRGGALLVSAAVNGNHPHCCRCSEFIAALGYGLNLCAIHI